MNIEAIMGTITVVHDPEGVEHWVWEGGCTGPRNDRPIVKYKGRSQPVARVLAILKERSLRSLTDRRWVFGKKCEVPRCVNPSCYTEVRRHWVVAGHQFNSENLYEVKDDNGMVVDSFDLSEYTNFREYPIAPRRYNPKKTGGGKAGVGKTGHDYGLQEPYLDAEGILTEMPF